MHWNRLPRKVVESPSLEVQEMCGCDTVGMGWWLDLGILEVTASLNNSDSTSKHGGDGLAVGFGDLGGHFQP